MYTRQLNGILGIWVTAMALLASSAGAAVYSGGAGTLANPYQIRTATDWATLSATTADWNKHFVLMKDIDFGGAFVTPVISGATKFTGVFDGEGHVLRNGKIKLPENDNVGLFGILDAGGVIRNLGVEMDYLTGRINVGGLVGNNDGGTITSCYTTGTVTGDNRVGGLVGYNDSGTVEMCYATGAITGDQNVGGLVGYLYGGTVESCYAMGAAAGEDDVGGLAGKNYSTMTSCYATGTATGSGANVGGLVGFNIGTVTLCYWDKDTSGLLTSDGGEGRTTEEMTYPYGLNTYVDWSFTVWAPDVDGSINNGYPYLLGNVPSSGEGSCGCSKSTGKDLTPKALMERALGDWLLVGLSVVTLTAFSATRK
jgi:trimeric autotransporter adhesin